MCAIRTNKAQMREHENPSLRCSLQAMFYACMIDECTRVFICPRRLSRVLFLLDSRGAAVHVALASASDTHPTTYALSPAAKLSG